MSEGSFVQEINLYEFLKHYTKYTIFISVATLIGLIGGLVYTNNIQVPMYKSNATLILIQPTPTETKPTVINNYLELLKSRRVLEPVLNEVNINQSYEQFVNSVSTSSDKDTEVVKLSIATTNGDTSRKAVDATIQSFKEEVKRLYTVNTIQVVDPASTPKDAYNVRTGLQIILAGMVGFILSIIAVFFIYDFSLSTKSKKQNSLIDNKTIADKLSTIFRTSSKPVKATKPKAKTTKKSSAKAKKTTKKTTGK